jgi:hypothetical protein
MQEEVDTDDERGRMKSSKIGNFIQEQAKEDEADKAEIARLMVSVRTF